MQARVLSFTGAGPVGILSLVCKGAEPDKGLSKRGLDQSERMKKVRYVQSLLYWVHYNCWSNPYPSVDKGAIYNTQSYTVQ
jgi:hypothetical protein